MANFQRSRAAVETEGVFIGGWSIKQAFVPTKVDGHIGQYFLPSSQT